MSEIQGEEDSRISLVIVAGASGAGKSRLIDALIGKAADASTIALLTEFGAHVLKHQRVATASIGHADGGPGCPCCSFENELLGVLDVLADEAAEGAIKPFRRVIVELAGEADPSSVYALPLAFPAFRGRYRIDGMALLINPGVTKSPADMTPVEAGQLIMADWIITAKGKAAAFRGVRRRAFTERNREARILSWNEAAKLGPRLWQLPKPERPAFTPHADDLPGRLTLEDAAPVARKDLELWLEWVRYRFGAQIMLLSGLASTREDSGPLLVTMVRQTLGARIALPAWPESGRATKIEIAGRSGDFAAIRELWAQAKAGTLPGKLIG